MSNLFAAHQLKKTSKPMFSAYYYRQWTNYEMSYHQHNSIEIMYVINGHCHIELLAADSPAPLLFAMKKGEFILLDGNVPHRLLVKDEAGCRMLNVEFTFQNCEQALPTIGELAEQSAELAYFLRHIGSYAVLRDVDEVYAALKSLVLELDRQLEQRPVIQTSYDANQQQHQQLSKLQQQAASAQRQVETQTRAKMPTNTKMPAQGSLKQELLFTQLMLLIAGLFQASAEATAQATAAQHYVKQVQSYIQQHYDDGELAVEQLAKHVSIHPSYLHRIFRSEMGMTIVQYLNQFRLDKAMMLLRETDIAIVDICEFVGINSRQYFHELFKKHIGITPVQYREQSNRQTFDMRGSET